MAFLLILPTAIFGLVALLVAVIDGLIEIAERRRVASKSPRRGFRPVVIDGGRSEFLRPKTLPDDAVGEPAPNRLWRSAPP